MEEKKNTPPVISLIVVPMTGKAAQPVHPMKQHAAAYSSGYGPSSFGTVRQAIRKIKNALTT